MKKMREEIRAGENHSRVLKKWRSHRAEEHQHQTEAESGAEGQQGSQ